MIRTDPWTIPLGGACWQSPGHTAEIHALAVWPFALPSPFKHRAITWLTRHSPLADAELQLITGHPRRETLAVYQHVALDGDLEQKYQEAMKKVDL
jgi:hypothetical protein